MLKRYRKSKDWTLQQAADHFGLSVSYIHQLESGRKPMTLTAARIIAAKSPLTVTQLLGLKERA